MVTLSLELLTEPRQDDPRNYKRSRNFSHEIQRRKKTRIRRLEQLETRQRSKGLLPRLGARRTGQPLDGRDPQGTRRAEQGQAEMKKYSMSHIDAIAEKATDIVREEFEKIGKKDPPKITSGIVKAVLVALDETPEPRHKGQRRP